MAEIIAGLLFTVHNLRFHKPQVKSVYKFPLPSLLVVPLGRALLVGPTAAVERAHSDRARSGSKGLTGVSFRPFVLGCRACRR
jgi:hypothetical protein